MDAPLMVNKSRKQFLEFSILPKNERKTWKNYPKSSQDIFFSSFVRFFGRIENCNIFFEIYSPLATDEWTKLEFFQPPSDRQ